MSLKINRQSRNGEKLVLCHFFLSWSLSLTLSLALSLLVADFVHLLGPRTRNSYHSHIQSTERHGSVPSMPLHMLFMQPREPFSSRSPAVTSCLSCLTFLFIYILAQTFSPLENLTDHLSSPQTQEGVCAWDTLLFSSYFRICLLWGRY